MEAETWSDSTLANRTRWSPTTDITGELAATVVENNAVTPTDITVPVLTYNLNYSEADTYYFWLLGRNAGIESASVEISFTNNTGESTHTIDDFGDQWQWLALNNETQLITFEVEQAGPYVLRISSKSTGLLLDKIVLTQRADYAPENQGPASTLSGNANALTEIRDDTPVTDNDADTNNEVVTDDNARDAFGETTTSPVTTTNAEAEDARPVNQAPRVRVDSATEATANSPLSLRAIATDDGRPDNVIYYYWTQLTGPANTQFSDIRSANPTAIFPTAGNYVLQLNAHDGELYSNQEITVTVQASAETPTETTSEIDNSNPGNTSEDTHTDDSSINLNNNWNKVNYSGKPSKRHETGGVVVDGKLYMIGGRRSQPVDVYDPSSNRWTSLGNTPFEMSHFQPVAIGTKIYIIGGFTGRYPLEDSIDQIQIFDTKTGRWSKGAHIPANRRRGSAGAALYNGKIYILGGNTKGHSGGAVNWFDEFDPRTGNWKTLANAPDSRDHVNIAVVGNKLVVAGGRRSSYPDTFGNTVAQTNVYDFNAKKWQRTSSIPTKRAGAMTVQVGFEVLILGGESKSSSSAHDEVEAYNVNTKKWRRLKPMITGRHSGVAVVLDGAVHVVAGATHQGGRGETNSHHQLR